MKIITTMMAGAVVALLSWMQSAQAQGSPQGSYLQTCTDVRVQGDALVATCRTADGRGQRSSLAGFKRCIGDIGNNNGVLECNFASGAQGRGAIPDCRCARGSATGLVGTKGSSHLIEQRDALLT